MRLITSIQEFLDAQQSLRDLRFLTSPEAESLKNQLRLRLELALDKGIVHFEPRPGRDPILVEGPRN